MKDTFVDKYSTPPATRRTLNRLLSENAILRIGNIDFTEVDLSGFGAAQAKLGDYREVMPIRQHEMAAHDELKADLYKVAALTAVRDYAHNANRILGTALNKITTPLGLGEYSVIDATDMALGPVTIPQPEKSTEGGEYATYQDASELLNKASTNLSTLILLFNRAADRLGVRRITDRGIGVAHLDLTSISLSSMEFTPRPLSAHTLTSVPATQRFTDLCDNFAIVGNRINDMIEYIKSVNVNPETPTAKPEITSVPNIAGTPEVGQTLTLAKGDVVATGAPEPVLSVRWFRGDQPLGQETGWAYVVTLADAGKEITAEVTATNSVGSDTEVTAAVEIKIPQPVNTAVPTINGVAKVGSVLNSTNGDWDNIVGIPTYAVEWYKEGDTPSEANRLGVGPTLTLTDEHAGIKVFSRVMVTNDTGVASDWAQSAAFGPVNQTPFVKTVGVIAVTGGEAKVGGTVEISTAPVLGGSPAATDTVFAWEVGGIRGAYGAAAPYTIKAGDEGLTVVLIGRASNVAGTFEAAVSNTITLPAEFETEGGGDGTGDEGE